MRRLGGIGAKHNSAYVCIRGVMHFHIFHELYKSYNLMTPCDICGVSVEIQHL